MVGRLGERMGSTTDIGLYERPGEERPEESGKAGGKSRRVNLGCLSLDRQHLVILGVAIGILIFITIIITVTFLVLTSSSASSKPLPSFPTGGDMLDFLVQTGHMGRADGLLATWYHRANNKSEMNKALESSAMILEADVTVEGFGTANQKPIPIMAHPPHIYSDNTLDQWLEAVLRTRKGIKLDFMGSILSPKSLASLGPSLDLLTRSDANGRLNRPVWINADVVIGPNVPDYVPVVNGSRFLQLVQEKFPNVTVSPGWKVGYFPPGFVETYSRAMVEEMYDLVKDLPQKVTFPVHALLVRNGWQHISWLLSRLPRSSLTLWQGKVHPEINDLLFVRDNSHPSRVYYDIYEPTLSAFKQAANAPGRLRRFYPGGDLMEYFYPATSCDRDSLAGVQWFIVSDRASLLAQLSEGGGGMLVVRLGSGSAGLAVPLVEASGGDTMMSEPLTLLELLDLLPGARGPWGLYLRVQSLELLEASLRLLSSAYSQDQLYRPVWVNAQLLDTTPNAQGSILPEDLVSTVDRCFPFVTLVLRGRSWPPRVVAAAQRLALHVVASLLPGSSQALGHAWASMEGWDLLVEEDRGQNHQEDSQDAVSILQAFSHQPKGPGDTRVYYISDQSAASAVTDTDSYKVQQ